MKHHSPLFKGGTNAAEYIHIQDEKGNAVQGGSFAQDAWRTRDLTVIKTDETGLVTLGSNQFILPAGTYRISAYCAGYDIQDNKTRLYNITDSATELVGTCAYNDQSTIADCGNQSTLIVGQFTIDDSKTFEIQHICNLTSDTFGFGVASGSTDTEVEIFTNVEFWRVK